MHKKKSKIYYLLLLPITFLLLMSFLSWLAYSRGEASKKWSKTNGVILSSRIEKRTSSRGKKRDIYNYSTIVKYQFKVKGKIYFGSTIHYKVQNTDKESALLVKNIYPVGKEVTVYYDHNDIGNPNKTVLEIGSSLKFPLIITSILFILIFFFAFLWYKNNIKK
jgi:LysM repeat protein